MDDSDAEVMVEGVDRLRIFAGHGVLLDRQLSRHLRQRGLPGDKLAEDRVIVAERVGRAGVDEELRIICVRPSRIGQRQLIDAGECQLLDILVGKGRVGLTAGAGAGIVGCTSLNDGRQSASRSRSRSEENSRRYSRRTHHS